MFCPEGRIFSPPVRITFGGAKRFQAFRENFYLRPWPRTRRSPFPSGGRRRPPSHARRLSDEGERTVSASPLIRCSPSSPASRELPPLGEAQTRGNVGLRRRGGACPAPLSDMGADRREGHTPSPMGTGETDRHGEPLPSAAGVTRRCHLPRRGRQSAPEARGRASGDGEWFNLYSRGSRLQ